MQKGNQAPEAISNQSQIDLIPISKWKMPNTQAALHVAMETGEEVKIYGHLN